MKYPSTHTPPSELVSGVGVALLMTGSSERATRPRSMSHVTSSSSSKEKAIVSDAVASFHSLSGAAAPLMTGAPGTAAEGEAAEGTGVGAGVGEGGAHAGVAANVGRRASLDF